MPQSDRNGQLLASLARAVAKLRMDVVFVQLERLVRFAWNLLIFDAEPIVQCVGDRLLARKLVVP
jgi:hypothetical protein